MKQGYSVEGFTIAVVSMDKMLGFYRAVFGIEFSKQEMFGTALYSSTWDRMNVLFCPREIARNSATQNRHQFDVVVDDLAGVRQKVIDGGGKFDGPVPMTGYDAATVTDPDGNTMVFKQLKG